MKTVSIGSLVKYVDEHSVERDALCTQQWGQGEYDEAIGGPAINIVFVSLNEKETDQYGRQTKHETSVVHRAKQGAPGKFWYQP